MVSTYGNKMFEKEIAHLIIKSPTVFSLIFIYAFLGFDFRNKRIV